MNKQTKKYRKTEFKKVNTIYNNYKTCIKIVKPNGNTNWLTIDNEEFNKIVELLTESKITSNCYGEIEFK
jgi:hypothetical protein